MKRITIEVPEELISLVGSDEEAQTEAKEALVFNLVRRGKISKGKAAELLGVVVWELPNLLAKYQIPWFTYGLKEVEEDVKRLREVERTKGGDG